MRLITLTIPSNRAKRYTDLEHKAEICFLLHWVSQIKKGLLQFREKTGRERGRMKNCLPLEDAIRI